MKILWINMENLDYSINHYPDIVSDIDQLYWLKSWYKEKTQVGFDRSEVIHNGLNMINVSPVPDVGDFNKSIEEICIERAQQLISRNKPINLFWSGGIDSTCVLVSLLRAGINKEQLRIILRYSALDENIDFFKNHIVGKLNYVVLSNNSNMYRSHIVDSSHINLTGEYGDQIFGWFASFMPLSEYYNEPYEKYANPKLIELTRPLLNKFSIPIVTLFDFSWLLTFFIGWQEDQFYHSVFSPSSITCLDDFTYECFFIADDFQRWSMYNHDKKVGKTFNTYKHALKKIIYDYDRNENYFNHKLKIPSIKYQTDVDKYYHFRNDFLFITEDREIIRRGDLDE